MNKVSNEVININLKILVCMRADITEKLHDELQRMLAARYGNQFKCVSSIILECNLMMYSNEK